MNMQFQLTFDRQIKYNNRIQGLLLSQTHNNSQIIL